MSSTVTYRDASPLLPIYLICDASGSMDCPERGMSPKPIDVLNDSIINLFMEIFERPSTVIDIHLSIISFSDRAVLNRAMDAVDSGATFTPLKASGLTTLSAGLEMFEKRLDIDECERYPRRSFRPVAFVLTDGKPTDSEEEWGRIIDRLGSRGPFPPRIIPCTLGKPEPAVLERLTKAYRADTGVLVEDILIDGRDVAQRISSLFDRLSHTLVDIQISADMTTHDTRDQVTVMDATIAEALTSARNTTTVSFDDILSGYR